MAFSRASSRTPGADATFGVLVGLVDLSRRHCLAVVLLGVILAIFSAWYASGHLGIDTNTDDMFAESLPWRQRAIALNRDFPQFTDLIVAVISADEPEEADATAASLAAALEADHTHFHTVRRPDASTFFQKEGLLFLDKKQLEALLNQTIDAQPFLGQLAADPSARGLFSSLSLLGMGVEHGEADLGPYLGALRGFHQAMADAIAGHPQPLSWTKLLSGQLSELGGKYKFVLLQPKLDYGSLSPGGAATAAIRAAAAQLEFVKSGQARVQLTGSVPISDEEFSTVAQGAVAGLIGSVLLITLWLFLAVHSWRLIVPILFTLLLGLTSTLLFASVAVGTLNLVSVGFGILFVGIAVDFAIQFSVRYRGVRFETPEPAAALRETGRRVGAQILVASLATAAGFLAFVPTAFRGVGELGLIAGVGMLIAFACTMIFLPAALTLCRPRAERASVGFSWGRPLDSVMRYRRRPVVTVFIVIALAGLALLPRLSFDSDPLHTKNAHTEAMRTLYELMESPVTNPFTIDILTPNATGAGELAKRIAKLPTVAQTLSVDSFVPDDQEAKLALIADASNILAPTIAARPAPAPVTPEQLRLAARTALDQIRHALPKLPPKHPLADIADDLAQLTTAPDAVLLATNQALTRFLPAELEHLRLALEAEPVTFASLPPEITHDWLLPDGQARVQVVPKRAASNSAGLFKFVNEVKAVAPDAGGSAVTIVATSETIIGAFRTAAISALVAIAVILLVALRRLLDVALVLAPLLLSALMTVILAVLLPLPLNYANIIALPLLLGVGVSFNIYFVMNWRAGRIVILGSPTARAILFSALTTATAFGSLALSADPGTASMGKLLLISLACTLVASLVFIPALLASVKRANPS